MRIATSILAWLGLTFVATAAWAGPPGHRGGGAVPMRLGAVGGGSAHSAGTYGGARPGADAGHAGVGTAGRAGIYGGARPAGVNRGTRTMVSPSTAGNVRARSGLTAPRRPRTPVAGNSPGTGTMGLANTPLGSPVPPGRGGLAGTVANLPTRRAAALNSRLPKSPSGQPLAPATAGTARTSQNGTTAGGGGSRGGGGGMGGMGTGLAGNSSQNGLSGTSATQATTPFGEDENTKRLHSHLGQAMTDGKLTGQERQDLTADLKMMLSHLPPAQAAALSGEIQKSLVASGMTEADAAALIGSAMQP